jgi:hypothetical protein
LWAQEDAMSAFFLSQIKFTWHSPDQVISWEMFKISKRCNVLIWSNCKESSISTRFHTLLPQLPQVAVQKHTQTNQTLALSDNREVFSGLWKVSDPTYQWLVSKASRCMRGVTMIYKQNFDRFYEQFTFSMETSILCPMGKPTYKHKSSANPNHSHTTATFFSKCHPGQ